MTGAEWLARFLKAQQIDALFSVSGNQIMPIYDGCLSADLRIIHARHESACVFMAEGYAQIAQRPGVALVTAGSGFMNALGAAFAGKHTYARVLLLSGDSPTKTDGCGSFQEMQQTQVAAPEFPWSRRPESVQAMVQDLQGAMAYLCSDTCDGPAHIALPADVLCAPCDAAISQIPAPTQITTEAESLVTQIAGTVAAAKRPVIILGPRHHQAHHQGLINALRARFECPVYLMESPRGVNDPSAPQLGSDLADADWVISLGKPIDFTLQFGQAAPEAQWMLIDHSEAMHVQARKNLGARLANCSDIPSSTCLCAMDLFQSTVSGQLTLHPGIVAHHKLFQGVSNAVSQQSRSVILVSDGGEFGQWVQAACHSPRRIINGVAGTIGGGLCYAMGAQVADPEALVLAFMGDGTIGFHLAEYETAARENLPVVSVIGNDQRWNAEYQIQLRDYGAERLYGCELSSAAYGAVTQALGCLGFDLLEQTTDAVDAALQTAFKARQPACLNVPIEPLAFTRGAK